jgi:hypothetical protein
VKELQKGKTYMVFVLNIILIGHERKRRNKNDFSYYGNR